MLIQLYHFLKINFKDIKIEDHIMYINLTHVLIFVQKYSVAKSAICNISYIYKSNLWNKCTEICTYNNFLILHKLHHWSNDNTHLENLESGVVASTS